MGYGAGIGLARMLDMLENILGTRQSSILIVVAANS